MPGDDKEGTGPSFPSPDLRIVTRQYLHDVWKEANGGATLSGEDALLAKVMREHPEYHNTWEFAEVVGAEDVVIDGVNPYLHITMHAIVENQIARKDPPEVPDTLERLLEQGMTRHEAIHAIAAEVVEVAFPVFQGRELFKTKRYIKRLRHLARP